MSVRRVSFALPGEDDLDRLKDLRPDDDWRELQTGERAWILQTFLRLRQAGQPVELVTTPPGLGTAVFHAGHKREVFRARRSLTDTVLIGVRGDLRDPLIADVQVLQNGRFADGRRHFYIPHWPQPGLRPRRPDREARVERVAFKGFDRNLHPDLRAPAWRDFLGHHGIEWLVDSVEYRGRDTAREAIDWPDFTDVDVVVAVRPPDRRFHLAKPATKLINAWLAGVPAILGPEYAYRELRRSELDYIEVSSIDDAGRAVLGLRDDPDRYRAMVDNGLDRAQEYTVAAVTERWRSLLFDTVPALADDPAFRRLRRLPLPTRRAVGRLQQLLGLRRSR
jgi:hypothetical protein